MVLEKSRQVSWADVKRHENLESMKSSSINNYSSEASISSTLSAELADDATSSSTSNSSPSRGPLYELNDLMAQLPIKRGLSKYYKGKSQTFASLANVKCVEDLAKEEVNCYSKRMKWCKSYGSNMSRYKFGPKATIAKRSHKESFSPSLPAKDTMVVN